MTDKQGWLYLVVLPFVVLTAYTSFFAGWEFMAHNPFFIVYAFFAVNMAIGGGGAIRGYRNATDKLIKDF